MNIEDVRELLSSHIFDLKPTQKRLCWPILQRICYKMAKGVTFDGIHFKDELLINGHHRYICSTLLNKQLEKIIWNKPSVITAYKWTEVVVDLHDWESIEIIERHNIKDALNNGLDIQDLQL